MTASHLPPIPLTLEPPTFLTPSSLKRASNRISTLHHYHRVELTFCSPLSLYALQVRYVLSQVFDGRAVDNRRTLREFTQSLIDSVEMAGCMRVIGAAVVVLYLRFKYHVWFN